MWEAWKNASCAGEDSLNTNTAKWKALKGLKQQNLFGVLSDTQNQVRICLTLSFVTLGQPSLGEFSYLKHEINKM